MAIRKITNRTWFSDSYKDGHLPWYPNGIRAMWSYGEARPGGEFPTTCLFGAQYILEENFAGPQIATEHVVEFREASADHFSDATVAEPMAQMFDYIVETYDGHLPLEIWAAPEGKHYDNGNVLIAVQNTDAQCNALVGWCESQLLHVWSSSTVAALSYYVRQLCERYARVTADDQFFVNFQLHDFGYRGVSSDESAAICGAAHLLNFLGTDNKLGIAMAKYYYGATSMPGFSVKAAEHSVMTSEGEEGEFNVVKRILQMSPIGIQAMPIDSYDSYHFVKMMGQGEFKQLILNRLPDKNGNRTFVFRPDSVTETDPHPEDLVVWILRQLWHDFGGKANSKGYRVLNPSVRVLWGDGIGIDGVGRILYAITQDGFSSENVIFGMGGGLLQKNNRDTQKWAFKNSAQLREDGSWFNVQKKTYGKVSKAGRLMLVDGQTVPHVDGDTRNELQRVLLNGCMENKISFNQARANSGWIK